MHIAGKNYELIYIIWVISCCKTPPNFKFCKQVLNFIAQFIGCFVKAYGCHSLLSARVAGLDSIDNPTDNAPNINTRYPMGQAKLSDIRAISSLLNNKKSLIGYLPNTNQSKTTKRGILKINRS